ncbi:MAG: hypothetical protein IH840_04780 [Candidatus Heimdallarchaeota archaeon]|nr:hypothetical protein [Candidatus Heimdallarchaeota archaeon]
MALFVIFIILVLLFVQFFGHPKSFVISNPPKYGSILGPFAYESTEPEITESWIKIYAYAMFQNNSNGQTHSLWPIGVALGYEDNHERRQKITFDILVSARYGSDDDFYWDVIPVDFLLVSNSLNLMKSRTSVEYTKSTDDIDQNEFTYLATFSLEETFDWDNFGISDRVEIPILLHNTRVTEWYYGDCSVYLCVTQLRIMVRIGFYKLSFFGSWSNVKQHEYILGNGEPSSDVTHFPLTPVDDIEAVNRNLSYDVPTN